MIKRLSISVALSTLSLLSLAVFPALAQDTTVLSATTTPTTIPPVVVPGDTNASGQINPSSEGTTTDIDRVSNLETLKKKGANLIKHRLDALNKLARKVTASKLTDAQKAQLLSDITANVNGLNELGVKIAAGNDVVAVRALVKSIITDFRIFAVAIPRVSGLMNVWLSLANIEQVTVSLAEAQIKIDALKVKGVDTSKMEALMIEIKTNFGIAKTKLEAAAATLTVIKPADYPSSSETFRRVRTLIREAQKQVTKARQMIHRLNALTRLANQAETRKAKLLERRAKEKARKAKHEEKKDDRDDKKEERKEEREDDKEKRIEVKDAIKTLRDKFKQDVEKLKNASTTN